jgi:hypothetical protein
MVGRLELVTLEQRAHLAELSRMPVPTQQWAYGDMPRAYRALGRFRNALLLDEFQAHPTPSLEAFIRLNRLQ